MVHYGHEEASDRMASAEKGRLLKIWYKEWILGKDYDSRAMFCL